MRQITIRQLVRQGSEAKIRDWMPCEITVDGVVIAVLVPACDVRQTGRVDVRQATKASHDVNKGGELKFSKASQTRGRMRG